VKSRSLKKIANNSLWLFLDKVGRILLKLVTSVLIANYLGSDLFGSINYTLSLILILFSMSSLGLNGIAVKEMVGKSSEQISKIITNSFFLKSLASIVCLSLAIISIVLFIEDTLVSSFALILAFGYVFKSFEVIDFWFQSNLRSKIAVISRFIAFLTISIIQLIAVWFQLDGVVIVCAMALESLIIAGFYVYFYLKEERFVFSIDWELCGRLLSKSWPLILSAFGSIIYLKSDQVMIEYFLDKKAVGVYAVAVQYSEIWYFIPNAIAISLFPVLLSKKNEALLDKLLTGSYSIMFVLSLVISIVTTIVGPYIIEILYKKEFWEAGYILTIHIWAGIFIFMRSIFSKWLLLSENYIHSLSTHLIGAIINVVLNLFLIPIYGIKGAAFATLISYGFSSYLALWCIPSLWKVAKQMTLAMIKPVSHIKFVLKNV